MATAQSTSDLRAAAQDYKRDAEQKAKWANGAMYTRGRGGTDVNPRPVQMHEALKPRHWTQRSTHSTERAGKIKLARKQDIVSAENDYTVNSEDSSASADSDVEIEATAPDAGVMYSFDAVAAPTHGSQILNTALAKAIEKYEDKETTKLVRNEYEILDAGEEELGLTPIKSSKGKGKAIDAEDEEYEFV